MEAALRLKVESLTQELSGYTTRLQALNDARTAVEASEARTASQLKSAQQGLRKYEATIERLTIENGKLTDRLRTEVQAASIKSAQRERDAAQLSQHAQAAEAHADATSKSLAASQEATRQALADLAEATATTVQLRDENAAQRVNLEKTEMMLRKQTRERENLALEAAQLRQNMSMLQDSVPSQVAALSDARTAAETQALKLRQEMATMKQALSDQNTKFDKLAEQHGENERRRVSDRKAWSAARARMEGEICGLQQQVAALKSANAVGDRSLKIEARAKSRADAIGSKAQQAEQELRDRNTRLLNQLREMKSRLAAEIQEHKLCRAQYTEAQHKIQGLTNELTSERHIKNSLQVSLTMSANKQAQLDTMLKSVSRASESLGSMGISTRSINTSNLPKLGGLTRARKAMVRKRHDAHGAPDSDAAARHGTPLVQGTGGRSRSSISALRKQVRESLGSEGVPASFSFSDSVTDRESEGNGDRGFDQQSEEASSSPLLHPVYDGAQGLAYKV